MIFQTRFTRIQALQRAVITAGLLTFAPAVLPASGIDRTALPIADPEPIPVKELDVRSAQPPPRFEVKAPQGAPNVLVDLQ